MTVEPVSPATPTAAKALAQVRAAMPSILTSGTDRVAAGTLPFIGWGSSLTRVQCLDPEHHAKPWFFIGDLHGDFLAWHLLFERVRATEDFRLCFVGDLVDRGPLSIECFAALLQAAAEYPDRILWITGNHDEGVTWNTDSQTVSSDTSPSEFVDWLNDDSDASNGQVRMAWARLFTDVVRGLPRAMLFDDGLLATHGGFPLQDLWPSLTERSQLESWRASKDFTWGRWKPNLPRNAIWMMADERATSASRSGFGYKDFTDFCTAMTTMFPVQRMVRGHDHIEAGWDAPPKYANHPVLTLTASGFLNAFGMTYSTEASSYRESLALGIGCAGALPGVELIAVPASDCSALYGQLLSASSADAPHPSAQ